MKRTPGVDAHHLIHWSYVGAGAPWQRTGWWKPPTEPAPTEADRIAALEQRVVRHLRDQDELIAALANRLKELEAQMRPTAETFEQPELSYQRAKAEQLRSQAALLLAQANLVEAQP